jgi:hypothetical protein
VHLRRRSICRLRLPALPTLSLLIIMSLPLVIMSLPLVPLLWDDPLDSIPSDMSAVSDNRSAEESIRVGDTENGD